MNYNKQSVKNETICSRLIILTLAAYIIIWIALAINMIQDVYARYTFDPANLEVLQGTVVNYFYSDKDDSDAVHTYAVVETSDGVTLKYWNETHKIGDQVTVYKLNNTYGFSEEQTIKNDFDISGSVVAFLMWTLVAVILFVANIGLKELIADVIQRRKATAILSDNFFIIMVLAFLEAAVVLIYIIAKIITLFM